MLLRLAKVILALALVTPCRASSAQSCFQKAVFTTSPDRQIQLYQQALREDPGFHQARHNLASAYYRKGLFRKAIRQYEQIVRDRRAYYQTFYNLACCYSRGGDEPRAFKALTRSLEKGFRDRTLLELDEDLAPLRSKPEFLRLMTRYARGRSPVAVAAATRRQGHGPGGTVRSDGSKRPRTPRAPQRVSAEADVGAVAVSASSAATTPKAHGRPAGRAAPAAPPADPAFTNR